jgi:hypothetical protein
VLVDRRNSVDISVKRCVFSPTRKRFAPHSSQKVSGIRRFFSAYVLWASQSISGLKSDPNGGPFEISSKASEVNVTVKWWNRWWSQHGIPPSFRVGNLQDAASEECWPVIRAATDKRIRSFSVTVRLHHPFTQSQPIWPIFRFVFSFNIRPNAVKSQRHFLFLDFNPFKHAY